MNLAFSLVLIATQFVIICYHYLQRRGIDIYFVSFNKSNNKFSASDVRGITFKHVIRNSVKILPADKTV